VARRIAEVAGIAIVVIGLSVLADDTLGGQFEFGLTVDVGAGGVIAFDPLVSSLETCYSTCGWMFESYSEFQQWGYIFQGFNVAGTLGAIASTGDVLFGPAGAGFLYAQTIVALQIAGVTLELYTAHLEASVLGGPADGMVVRIAANLCGIDVESITEVGADLSGITVVHGPTGAEHTFVTDPTVPGSGFTGQRILVRGWTFACAVVDVTVRFACGSFEGICLDIADLQIAGIAWLTFDFAVCFDAGALGKTFTFVPRLSLEPSTCITLYAALIPEGGFEFTGIGVYGVEIEYSWGAVTFRSVSLLDPCVYAITMPAYGARPVSIEAAAAHGWDVYPGYWELVAIEVEAPGCCGGDYRFAAYMYFDVDSVMLFDWAMTEALAEIPIGNGIVLSGSLCVDDAGLRQLAIGVRVSW